MTEEVRTARLGYSGILLRLFFFFLFEIVGLVVFSTFLDELFGRLVAGALGIFFAAAAANSLTVRVFERGRMEDVGMGWSHASTRHLLLGALGGIAAGVLVVGTLRVLGLASWKSSPEAAFGLAKFLWVSTLLLFGAVGEELLFRGYGFQILMHRLSPWWVIPISAAIFGWVHKDNLNASPIGLANTALWGLVLGYAYYRAGDLWLPIGLHFGWNWILPVFGANLSGFTLALSGYTMEARGKELWSGGAYGPEASIITTGVAVLLLVWLWRARIGPPGDSPSVEASTNAETDPGPE